LVDLALQKVLSKKLIGRVDKRFDFLGYHFSPIGMTVAQRTLWSGF
jgi:hypothetical protein